MTRDLYGNIHLKNYALWTQKKRERIPLLQELMDLIQGKAGINIELKSPDMASSIVKFLESLVYPGKWQWKNILVSSFHHIELQKIKTLQPKIPTGALCIGVPLYSARFAEELKCSSLPLALDFVTPEIVKDAHTRGVSVYVFTVNDLETLAFVKSLDVDGVFTDFPDLSFNLFTYLLASFFPVSIRIMVLDPATCV